MMLAMNLLYALLTVRNVPIVNAEIISTCKYLGRSVIEAPQAWKPYQRLVEAGCFDLSDPETLADIEQRFSKEIPNALD